MVKDAPEIEEVMQKFYDWMGDSSLSSHIMQALILALLMLN